MKWTIGKSKRKTGSLPGGLGGAPKQGIKVRDGVLGGYGAIPVGGGDFVLPSSKGQAIGYNSDLMLRRDGTVEVVNPTRRERKKLGLSGRQARIARKVRRRAPPQLNQQ